MIIVIQIPDRLIQDLIKSHNEKEGKYNAAVSRSGHRFMPIILDKFGDVLQKTRTMMFQMFLRQNSDIFAMHKFFLEYCFHP